MMANEEARTESVTLEVEAEYAASAQALVELLRVMRRLRSPEGCPWDREQTHTSLRKYLIEESYEVAAALDQGDVDELCTELGDVLLQIVFHSEIGREEGTFTFAEVANAISAKMIHRHPHVFGGREDITTADDVLKIWEVLKQEEGRADAAPPPIVSAPVTLPALMRAEKLQSKAARVGFDWQDIDGPLAKVTEELNEFTAAATELEQRAEFGDLLFSLVNVARFLKINPEDALNLTNEKFIKRFAEVEQQVAASGRAWQDFTLAELDEFWDNAKKSR